MRKERKEMKLKWIISIIIILTIFFVQQKVFHYGMCKDWSWVWLLSPIWVPTLIVTILFLGIFSTMGMIWLLFYGVESFLNSRRSSKLERIDERKGYIPENIFPFKRF